MACWSKVNLTNRLPKLSLVKLGTLPPWNGGIFRSRPDIRVDVSSTRGFNFWGPRESIYRILDMKNIVFSLESVFMVDVRFEPTTNSSNPFDDAILC